MPHPQATTIDLGFPKIAIHAQGIVTPPPAVHGYAQPKLAGLATFWNPCGYQNLEANLRDFRTAWPCHIPLYLLDMTPGGLGGTPQPHETVVHVPLDDHQVMWQKEAALNLLLREHVPAEFDQVVWVDTDLIFLNPYWADETSRLLEIVPACQPFTSVVMLDAKGTPEDRRDAAALFPYRRHGSPGFAMAARREVVQEGLPWRHIVGEGDVWLWEAWCGRFNVAAAGLYSDQARRFYLAESIPLWKRVRQRVQAVPGEVAHLYHGRRENRKYHEQVAGLNQLGFSPGEHIALGTNGLARWSVEDKSLLTFVQQSFYARQEDDELRCTT